MKTLLGFALTLSIASAATLPTAKISGSYVEARNADVYTGACYANSEINLVIFINLILSSSLRILLIV